MQSLKDRQQCLLMRHGMALREEADGLTLGV